MLSFVLITILPGNAIATTLGNPQSGLSPAQVKQLETYYGVTKPIVVQLWLALSRFVRGQLGTSLISHQTVTSLIARRATVHAEARGDGAADFADPGGA